MKIMSITRSLKDRLIRSRRHERMSSTRSRATMVDAAIEIVAGVGALHCAGGHGDCGDIVADAAESFSGPAY